MVLDLNSTRDIDEDICLKVTCSAWSHASSIYRHTTLVIPKWPELTNAGISNAPRAYIKR